MAYVPPVSLPSAAGVDFGEGDVRHFSQGDSVSVPGLSNPTRQLAARDSLIAKTLNQVVAEVNNHEQIIPLPVYRMVVPPSSDEIVANHRIPVGYEARVLNAVISSSPVSADIELNILWSTGFGNVSGTTVMTTTNESAGGTTFSPAGEFIIQIKNKGSVTLDIVASVMVTMRPITDVSGALLPAATIAPPGPPGRKGDVGEKGGSGGVGPAGSPGLVPRGDWADTPFPISYSQGDVVSHDFAGTNQVSSYVCLQGHVANGVNEPQPSLTPSPFWNFLAEAGASGSSGSSSTSAVTIDFETNPLQLGLETGADFVAGNSNGDYTGGGSPNTVYSLGVLSETTITYNGQGNASISGQFKRVFAGSLALVLPKIVDGATVDWDSDNTSIVVSSNGTVPVRTYGANDFADSGTFYEDNGTYFLGVPGNVPIKVSALIHGTSTF